MGLDAGRGQHWRQKFGTRVSMAMETTRMKGSTREGV